jgi:phospholipid/cholesterol/gamma-HCH transport system substrate-binding protein
MRDGGGRLMVKQTPGRGRMAAMIVFALSCVLILLFLWVSFGGSVPLSAKSYRVKVAFPEAQLLVTEADVRISGINVGKVKKLTVQKSPPRTVATLEIDHQYGPIPKDTKATLRQKTLLGETYVELAPGNKSSGNVADGGRLADGNVAGAVTLDDIYQAFDPPTRQAIRGWIGENAKVIDGRSVDLNAVLGNLPGFASSGNKLLGVLDARGRALHDFVRNTGVVFAALNQRDQGLHDLILNSNRLFQTTAERDNALAEIIQVFPTFLDETKATLARLETFSRTTDPLVQDLRPVARDLGPTVRDIGALSPDLTNLFHDIDFLSGVAPNTLPDAARVLRGARPVLQSLTQFLPELNPILSFGNFHAATIADFTGVGAAALGGIVPGTNPPNHYLRQLGIINDRSLALNLSRPAYERGNAYLAPNAWQRFRPLGVLESFDCSPAGGVKREPTDALPPCYVQPPSLWDDKLFPRLERGKAPLVPPPLGNEGTRHATR